MRRCVITVNKATCSLLYFFSSLLVLDLLKTPDLWAIVKVSCYDGFKNCKFPLSNKEMAETFYDLYLSSCLFTDVSNMFVKC